MTPERLRFIIEACRHRQRATARAGHYLDIARFLHRNPVTLRRWLSGSTPIPREVEIVFEILHAFPSIDAAEIQRLIDARDMPSSRKARR